MMLRKLLVLNVGLIFLVTACKEVTPESTPSPIIDSNPPTTVIPERPTEIEVLDLTADVDLFVVIAGAYSSVSGAQKKADALKKVGFSNADIIQRPGSKLYSALVERFDSEAAAQAFATEIATNREIKSYVYKLDD